jgi:hypothetical protein
MAIFILLTVDKGQVNVHGKGKKYGIKGRVEAVFEEFKKRGEATL